MRGCLINAAPVSLPEPVTRLMTPFGKPANSRISTNAYAHIGVSEDGLKTMVLPQIKAAEIFQAGMAMGKFQGVMIPTTPRGMRMEQANLLFNSEGVVWPCSLRPSPAMYSKISMASWTSPLASLSTLPISCVSSFANLSLFFLRRRAVSKRIWPRVGAGVSRHWGKADSAALTASSASAAVADWKNAMGCSVAGFKLGKVFPEEDGSERPAI